jgi:hypothetical protein
MEGAEPMHMLCPLLTAKPGHRSFHTAESALGSASALLRDAMQLVLDDFTKTLKQHADVPSPHSIPFGGASSVGADSLSLTAPKGKAAQVPKAGEHELALESRSQSRLGCQELEVLPVSSQYGGCTNILTRGPVLLGTVIVNLTGFPALMCRSQSSRGCAR